MSSRSLPESDDALREIAASWVIRRDRGLTAAEEMHLQRWLDADARHAAAMARATATWALLDQAPEAATRLPTQNVGRPRWPVLAGLAAAVAVGGFFLATSRHSPAPADSAPPNVASSATTRPPEPVIPDTQLLPDGTIVRLGSDSQVVEEFTGTERSVRLVRGEAYFTVTKDPQRPFFVHAGDVVVRAVGTAFNVQLQSQSVEVLVAEGTVQVAPSGNAAQPAAPSLPAPLVDAGHRAVVSLDEAAPAANVVVSALTAEEMSDALAQRERMLRLSGATLAELAAEFGRRTGAHVVIADPALATLRIGGRFRGDDVEGFVRVLESAYGIRSERTADGTLVLGRAR